MSNASDKKVVLGFAVDQRSLQASTMAVRQLTSEFQNLVKTMSQAGAAMNGMGGMFGGISAKSGGINASRESTMKGGSVLTQGIATDARALSATAKAGSEAMRSMTSGMKSSVSDQITKIQQLKRELTGLDQAYAKIGLNGRGLAMPNQGRFDGARAANRSDFARASLAMNNMEATSLGAVNEGFIGQNQHVVMKGGIATVQDINARRNWNPNLWGRADSTYDDQSAWGRGKRSALRIGGVVGGVIAAANFAQSMYVGNQNFHANENAALQQDMLRNRAGVNQAYGNVGMQIRTSTAAALAGGNMTPTEMRSALGQERFEQLIQKAHVDSGTTGSLIEAKNALLSGVGTAAQQAALQRALNDSPQLQAEAYQQVFQQRQAAASVKNTAYLNNFDSSYLGRMAIMRQAGVAGDYTTGPTRGSKAALLGAGSLWTNAETAGAMGAMRSQAGGRYSGEVTARSMLNYQAGGLSGAMGMYGAAAGYGNAGGFLGAVSGASSMHGGAGLVDVTAGDAIGSAYAGAMTAGDFHTDGHAGVAGMMATSALFGGDMRSARGSAAGYGALSAYSGGQTDRLQEGINVLASTRQGGTLYSQEALRNMSPAFRMDLMRKINSGSINSNSQLPPELIKQGVTIDMLKGYGSTRDKFMFSEYMNAQGSAPVNAAVNAWRKNGTGSLSGLKGRGLLEAIDTLGVAAFQAKRAPSIEAGKHMIAQIAAEDPSIFGAITSGGVGDVARGSIEGDKKIGDDLKNTLDQENYYSKSDTKEKIRQGFDPATTKMADALDRMGTTLNISATSVSKELSKLADDIAEVRRAIREDRQSRPRSVPKTGGKSGG